ncbi:Ig-like domain-containing protein [Pullulanibacillus sp. KACC 23026]|uniref:Ig-like domain-containing protein n=1 Tax=Pullulanibacillus sp. KACC 23026 TaxID=3028315 RepID=UPI0023B1FE32|nr:Ig-like domain-containing protein [Pullulanibacillus sp. KACC 23026]WEG13455.1 Ig-like domain-containing protein [Pullulanibacillus sp. KACC 23026]
MSGVARGIFPIVRKVKNIPLLITVLMIVFMAYSSVTKADSLDNQKVVFGNGADWMKSGTALNGDTLTIDLGSRFSYLDQGSIQLEAETQGNVTATVNGLTLQITIQDFGESTIKVKAVDKNGKTEQDQFQLNVTKTGDINGDGIINPSDALYIYQVTSGKISLSPEQLKLLDIDGDGKVTNADASLLMTKYVGKQTDTNVSEGNNFFVTLTDVNDAPIANDDQYSVDEDHTLQIDTDHGVLANDEDVEKDTLTAHKVSDPSHGSLTLNADGSFSYTPDANYNGKDTFTYKANDGDLDSEEQTVTIDVKSVNDAPVAKADSFMVNEDETLTVQATSSILANDTDVENDPLTAVLVNGPSHGTLSLNPDGTFSYTPNANYNGKDTFTYKANDGELNSAEQTVTIDVKPVNDAPIAKADSYTVNEDETLNVKSDASLLANDSDVDGDSLTAIKVSGPSHGTLSLNADGTFSYTPDANYNGKDAFTYKANDGVLNSDVQTVTIDVKSVNDAPVAKADSYSVNEDETLAVDTNILANDTDVDGDTLKSILVDSPSHGTLALNLDGTFSYTPDANYNGKDTFTYKAYDGDLYSNKQTVTIDVKPVNDAPVAKADSYTVNEDETLNVKSDSSILANDSDVDGDSLTAIKVSGPSHGTLTCNADGTFSYTPDANYNGKDTFTYKANDGVLNSDVQTVTIDVKPVDDAPVAKADSYSVNEDETLNVTEDTSILANDTDVDSPTLTAILVSGPSHGTLSLNANGTFSYIPGANYNGKDTFTYKANDGELNSDVQTVTINVKPVNDAPVAKADSYTVNEDETLNVKSDSSILANDTDVDGDSLTAIKVNGPSHGTLTFNTDGTFSYTPSANYNGNDSFTYKAFDGNLYSEEQTVTIDVKPVNDPPVADRVSLSGNTEVGSTLTGHYTYSDIENDPEGTSTYQWYRSANSDGVGKVAISGANSIDYTLQDADLGQYVFFAVTPVAATGAQTTQEYLSGASDPIKPKDITPPTVNSVSPANQATDVSTTDDLVATFSENVVAQNGTIAIHKTSDDSIVESFKANDTDHVVVDANKVTIKHSDLEQGVSYYVTIDKNAFTDMSGNAFAGLSDPTDWTFKTVVPVTLAADPLIPMSEDDLKDGSGSYITLQLDGDSFNAGISASDFVLNNAPSGVSILDVYYLGDGSAGVFLGYDGTDFDQNITNFSVTAKASATNSGQEVTSNPLTITADIEPPSAYFSQYVDGGNGEIAFQIKSFPGDTTGYTIDIYKWMKATNKKSIETLPVDYMVAGQPYIVIDSIFYDFFDVTPAQYYNVDDMIYDPNNYTLNAIVLKRNGVIVDVLGNPNSNGPDQFLPDGGTLVRNPNLIHGNTMFVNGEWQTYPKGTYQYIGQ